MYVTMSQKISMLKNHTAFTNKMKEKINQTPIDTPLYQAYGCV